MATRASRSGRKIPVTAADDTGLTYIENRAKIKLEKQRKKYEKDEAKRDSAALAGTAQRSTRAMSSMAQQFRSIGQDDAPLPSSSPSPSKKRKTRSGPISCTEYGPFRHSFFNKPVSEYFFCGQCDLWDKEKDLANKKTKQSSQHYKCIAGHTSRVFPTTRVKPHYQRVDVRERLQYFEQYRLHQEPKSTARKGLNFGEIVHVEQSSDESDSELEATTTIENESTSEPAATASIEDLRLIIANQQSIILDLRATVIVKNRKIRHLKNGVHTNNPPTANLTEEADDIDMPRSPAVKSGRKDRNSGNAYFHEKVTRYLDDLIKSLRWKRDRIGKELALLVFEYDDEVCHHYLIKKSKAWLRKHVFTCYNILSAMDQAGGTLSYEGIEIIRSAETKKVKWYKNSLIPSTAEFKRTAIKVEKLAHVLAPFVLGRTGAGDKESIDFQPYEKVVGTVFRAYGLLGVGRLKSLLCIFSLDGAKITKNLGHTMAGFKMVDRSMRCPFTKELLLADSTTANAQSRSYVFPLFLMMGPETKESVKEVEPMFKFMEACESEDPIRNPMTKEYGLLPMSCGANSDLSAGWKCLCKGGAAKVSNLPCHCCALHKDKWARPNSDENQLDCAWCQEINHDVPGDWKCYHHRMMTEESLAQGRLELDLLTASLNGNLALIDDGTKMAVDDVENSTPTSERNPTSIHYIPRTSPDREQYGILLSDELVLRDMSPLGTLSVKQNSLSIALRSEAKIRLLLTELEHGTPNEGAMFLLIQAIPCILHLENRVGIKILTMLFIEGLSNAKKGALYDDVGAEGRRIEMFFDRVAAIVNKQVLGTADNSTEWQCATDEKRKEIGTIQMDNMRTRKIMGQLELLVEECIVIEDHKATWLACIPKFRDGMIKLRGREDFDDAAIFSFQKDMDEFFQLWVELWGLEGCTNYIHMMSSGHLSVYLKKWKNLYRHSQQGWEAFNSLLKTFYFRRTQRGGVSNAGRGRKSRLLPVGRWLQRRVIWLCGYDQEFIESWIADNPGARRSGELNMGEDDSDEEELDLEYGMEGYI